MNETDFLHTYPNAKRLSEYDSLTVNAYMTEEYLWLFDKCDGHLAWKYNRKTKQTEYICECIKRGKAILQWVLK